MKEPLKFGWRQIGIFVFTPFKWKSPRALISRKQSLTHSSMEKGTSTNENNKEELNSVGCIIIFFSLVMYHYISFLSLCLFFNGIFFLLFWLTFRLFLFFGSDGYETHHFELLLTSNFITIWRIRYWPIRPINSGYLLHKTLRDKIFRLCTTRARLSLPCRRCCVHRIQSGDMASIEPKRAASECELNRRLKQ